MTRERDEADQDESVRNEADRDPDQQADEAEWDADADVSPDAVRQEMEPLEPYTTREIADLLDVPRNVARKLLNALYVDDQIEKKEPATDDKPLVWIRNPPLYTCPECQHEFRIRFVHPVFSSVHYCPQCGARVE